MVMHPAGSEVHEMGVDNENHREGKDPILIIVPDLFSYQQQYSSAENKNRYGAMVVLTESMPQ